MMISNNTGEILKLVSFENINRILYSTGYLKLKEKEKKKKQQQQNVRKPHWSFHSEKNF